jgi:hypothetical protein
MKRIKGIPKLLLQGSAAAALILYSLGCGPGTVYVGVGGYGPWMGYPGYPGRGVYGGYPYPGAYGRPWYGPDLENPPVLESVEDPEKEAEPQDANPAKGRG